SGAMAMCGWQRWKRRLRSASGCSGGSPTTLRSRRCAPPNRSDAGCLYFPFAQKPSLYIASHPEMLLLSLSYGDYGMKRASRRPHNMHQNSEDDIAGDVYAGCVRSLFNDPGILLIGAICHGLIGVLVYFTSGE